MTKSLLKTAVLAILFFISIRLTGQTKVEFPFQDTSLTVDARVDDLVSRLTLHEKVGQFFNNAEAIDRLGIPAYNWWNESLHGVARAGTATVFPQAIGMAASFDEDMMFQIATAISDEARAKHHYFLRNGVTSIYTGLTFWSPNINIFRDPRWGRGQETYGEDPYLTGRIGVNFVKGLQGNNPKYLKTVATAKHYAVHSGPEFTRHTDNIYVNDYDLYNTYLPAFKALVKEANVQSVMCAYNRFRDKPCCGSDLLLANILRNDFGFTGYVVSDCGAISDFYTPWAHHVVKTSNQAWGWSVATGTDLNCEENRNFLVANLDSAIKTGILNESDLNRSLKRLFHARFKLGMFDPDESVPYSKIPMTVVGSPEHLKLAQDAAVKAFVLLKNDGILPLSGNKKIALIGPNANNPDILIANYNGTPVNPITPLKGLQQKLGEKNVLYAAGCPLVPGFFANFSPVQAKCLFHKEKNSLKSGLLAKYFSNSEMTGEPSISRIDANIDFNWKKSPVSNKLEEAFSIAWTGVLIPEKTGKYNFGGNIKLKINGNEPGIEGINLEKGKEYIIEAQLVKKSAWWDNNIEPSANLTWVESSFDYTKEALDIAKKSDVIVFCGGISASLEGEEMPLEIDGFSHGDRTHINLPKIQEELLKALQKTGKPIVYVNFSGSAIALNWESENLPAILQGFYPGEATGTALTNILFGDANPSGRLPVTFYKSASDLPDFKDYRMEGRTYRYFKGQPLYEFGFGLSYTQFEYSNIKFSNNILAGNSVEVSADITNVGKRTGEEVAELYLSEQETGENIPLRSLVGFKRLKLAPGETKKVSFVITPEQFSELDSQFNRIIKPGYFVVSIGGKQPDANSIENKKVIQVKMQLSGNKIFVK